MARKTPSVRGGAGMPAGKSSQSVVSLRRVSKSMSNMSKLTVSSRVSILSPSPGMRLCRVLRRRKERIAQVGVL